MADGGTISVEALNELANILRRKLEPSWSEVAQALEDVKATLGPIRPINLNTHTATLKLSRQHGFSIHDPLTRLPRPARHPRMFAGRHPESLVDDHRSFFLPPNMRRFGCWGGSQTEANSMEGGVSNEIALSPRST